jgi:hypothetical protein
MSLRHDGLRRVTAAGSSNSLYPCGTELSIYRAAAVYAIPTDRPCRKIMKDEQWILPGHVRHVHKIYGYWSIGRTSYRTRAKVHPISSPLQPRKLADDVVLIFCRAFPLKFFRSDRCARHIRSPTSPTSIGAPSLSIHIRSMENRKIMHDLVALEQQN